MTEISRKNIGDTENIIFFDWRANFDSNIFTFYSIVIFNIT